MVDSEYLFPLRILSSHTACSAVAMFSAHYSIFRSAFSSDCCISAQRFWRWPSHIVCVFQTVAGRRLAWQRGWSSGFRFVRRQQFTWDLGQRPAICLTLSRPCTPPYNCIPGLRERQSIPRPPSERGPQAPSPLPFPFPFSLRNALLKSPRTLHMPFSAALSLPPLRVCRLVRAAFACQRSPSRAANPAVVQALLVSARLLPASLSLLFCSAVCVLLSRPAAAAHRSGHFSAVRLSVVAIQILTAARSAHISQVPDTGSSHVLAIW